MENTLNITVDRVYKLPDNGPVKAIIDLKINDLIIIRGLKVVEGQESFFVSMPQEQGKDKRWYESIRCLTNEVKQQIQDKVLEAYTKSL